MSDGSGYYAYLPALVIYNDATYESSLKAETAEWGGNFSPLYLHENEQGRIYNKYFPGIAVLQSPFFAAACTISWLRGSPIDGYSGMFQFLFYLGSIFYVFLGLFFFMKSIKCYFRLNKKLHYYLSLALYLCTPMLFYISEVPSNSHLYSFFLFSLFAFITLKIKENQTTKMVFLLGIILGFVFLVRPTNLVIVFTLPFLFMEKTMFLSFIGTLFKRRARQFIAGVFGFSIIASILFILWKWQTGNWIAWSYSGEGFNFLNPKILESLFSFRIGLFVHTPILLLIIPGLIIWYRKNSFSAISWLIYFVINLWIVSAWWCWDYSSVFGHRPLTEHYLFFIFPLIYFAQKYLKIFIGFFFIFALLGMLRLHQQVSGKMVIQRYTSSNYFSSLAFWDSKNDGRWQFTKSCQPFGKKIREDKLVEDGQANLDETVEYALTYSQKLIQPRTHERFYIKVDFEKKTKVPLQDVFLVIDATSNDEKYSAYRTIEIFNDRYEGIDEWHHIEIESEFYDTLKNLDKVKIYIWNKSRSSVQLKNVNFTLETYQAN